MQTADLDVIKDIPGYKVILKAVLRSQIQQLVEQLATHTEEESIILTASISDGTLCHLGSDSGKTFLEDHDDIKSQFLGFCLKRNHRKKQEKEKEALQLQMQQQQQQQQQQHQQQQRRFSGMRPGYTPARSPRFASKFSPRQPNIHPVALSRASPGAGVRHSPYPAARPGGKRSSLEQQGKRSGASTQQQNAAGNLDNSIIKIEPDDSEAIESAQSVSDANIETANVSGTVPIVPSSSQPSSPSQTPHSASTTSSKIKSESSDIKDDNEATGSPSAMQNPTTDDTLGESSPAMGLSLDSDLSNLISSEGLDSSNPETVTETVKPEQTGGEPEFDPSVSVKVEAISESDMELEITGVEPGNVDPMGSQDNWVPNIPGAMGYDPTGATGSQADMQDPEQGYNVIMDTLDHSSGYWTANTPAMGKVDGNNFTPDKSFNIPIRQTPGGAGPSNKWERPSLQCMYCGKVFQCKSRIEVHIRTHTGEKPHKCPYCPKAFADVSNLNAHIKGVHAVQPVTRKVKRIFRPT